MFPMLSPRLTLHTSYNQCAQEHDFASFWYTSVLLYRNAIQAITRLDVFGSRKARVDLRDFSFVASQQ
jgi:hypothetical protein